MANDQKLCEAKFSCGHIKNPSFNVHNISRTASMPLFSHSVPAYDFGIGTAPVFPPRCSRFYLHGSLAALPPMLKAYMLAHTFERLKQYET